MTHVSEGVLQALLDDELEPEARAEVMDHLAVCQACAAELDTLRGAAELFSRAVQALDDPAAEVVLRRRLKRRAMFAWSLGSLARAAVLVLGFAAVASAALPSSPVRGWAVAAWGRAAELFGRGGSAQAAAQERVQQPVTKAPPAGVSILPADGRVRIVLTGPAPESRIHVQLVDEPRAAVQATGGAATARFRIGTGRIEVVGGGAGDVHIEVPRGAQDVQVEVDGKPYVVKQGTDLRVLAPVVDSTGPEVILRAKPLR
jgi:hypothetical protein